MARGDSINIKIIIAENSVEGVFAKNANTKSMKMTTQKVTVIDNDPGNVIFVHKKVTSKTLQI